MKRIALTLAVMAFAVAAFAGETATVVRVIDGDTIRVWDGAQERPVRFIGVDTPEISLNRKTVKDAAAWGVTTDEIIAAGRVARDFVVAVAPPGSEVGIDAGERDMYGRDLAYVYLTDGECLNEVLLRDGYALAPRQYPHRDMDQYGSIEDAARRNGRGFWPTLWRNQDR